MVNGSKDEFQKRPFSRPPVLSNCRLTISDSALVFDALAGPVWRLEAYGEALRQLKRDDPGVEVEHRQAKYLNNRIEADYGQIKRLCRATFGFKSMKTAYATKVPSRLRWSTELT